MLNIKNQLKNLSFFSLLLPLMISCTSNKISLDGTVPVSSCTAGLGEDFPLAGVYNSTVFVEGVVVDKNTKKAFTGYTGSGGIIWQDTDSTVILTAAHVCDVSSLIDSIKKTVPNPDDVRHFLKISDRKNRVYHAISYVTAIKFDACLIQVSKIEGARALPLAKGNPTLGEIVYNVSSPLSLYSSEGSPMFKGYFSGNFKFINVSDEKHSLFSLPAAPGSSGSLLLNKNMEVIGVVSAVYTRFHHLTISPTLQQVKDLMSGNSPHKVKVFMDFTPQIVVEEKVFLWGTEVPEWDILEEEEAERWKIRK
jgi:S1-C subfamily serine protease